MARHYNKNHIENIFEKLNKIKREDGVKISI